MLKCLLILRLGHLKSCSKEVSFASHGATTDTTMTSEIKCPQRDCGRVNPAANAFCYYCGAVLGEWQNTAPELHIPPPALPIKAKLKLPDNREISLAMRPQWIGRDDLNGIVPENSVKYISRRHLIIGFENGQYYVEDQDSANGTKLNGTEIKDKGKFELNNGDLIEVAEVVAFSFNTS